MTSLIPRMCLLSLFRPVAFEKIEELDFRHVSIKTIAFLLIRLGLLLSLWMVALSVAIAKDCCITIPSERLDPTQYNTSFPLPHDVRNFYRPEIGVAKDMINFQTGLSLSEAIAFYRLSFRSTGLTERGINTAITDITFSLVFDSPSQTSAVVIQGVDLGPTTNINIRYEDI